MPSNPVFPWLDRHNFYHWSNPFCDEHVGIRFRPHQARVEYASRLNVAGVSPQGIAASSNSKGGPGGPRAIECYTRTSEDIARAANAKASPSRPADDQTTPTTDRTRGSK